MKRLIYAIALLTLIGCHKAPKKQCWDCVQSIIKLEGIKGGSETKLTVNKEFCDAASRKLFEKEGTYTKSSLGYHESSSVQCKLK